MYCLSGIRGMNDLIGKYINGYKITGIMQDVFIKDQINILTDGFVANWQGDRDFIVYRIRDSKPPERPQSVKDLDRGTLEQLYLDMMHLADSQCKRANRLEEVIDEAIKTINEYVCTEEYCGEVGMETTNFIERLGQILYKVKEK